MRFESLTLEWETFLAPRAIDQCTSTYLSADATLCLLVRIFFACLCWECLPSRSRAPPPLQALNSLLTSPSGWTGTRFVSVHCDAKDCVVAVEMGEKLLYERRVYGTLTWFWTLNNLRQANVSALWLLDSCATGACVERCQRVH